MLRPHSSNSQLYSLCSSATKLFDVKCIFKLYISTCMLHLTGVRDLLAAGSACSWWRYWQTSDVWRARSVQSYQLFSPCCSSSAVFAGCQSTTETWHYDRSGVLFGRVIVLQLAVLLCVMTRTKCGICDILQNQSLMQLVQCSLAIVVAWLNSSYPSLWASK